MRSELLLVFIASFNPLLLSVSSVILAGGRAATVLRRRASEMYGATTIVGWRRDRTIEISSRGSRWMGDTWRASERTSWQVGNNCARASHAGSKPPRVRRVKSSCWAREIQLGFLSSSWTVGSRRDPTMEMRLRLKKRALVLGFFFLGSRFGLCNTYIFFWVFNIVNGL